MPYTPLKISIPEPCHEDWGKMKPVSGTTARHCASCVKNVVDFTGFTDAQMHAYVREHKGKLCGRFRPDQLNRPLRAAGSAKSSPLRIAAAAAGLMLAATGCEPDTAAADAPLRTTDFIEVVMEEGIVIEPPATGSITQTEITGEEVVAMAVPGLMAPPVPPPPPEEVGEIGLIVGDIELDDAYLPEPLMAEDIVPVPPPPVCSSAQPDSLTADSIIVDDGMMLGIVAYAPPTPTGMDLFRDTLKSILPPSPKPTIEQTSHPVRNGTVNPRPRPNQLPPYLNNITLFPNPFVDKINLEIDVPEATKLRIILLNVGGQRVYSDGWNTIPGYNTLILSPPQTRLKGSLFYVQVTDEQGFTVTRPIIRR